MTSLIDCTGVVFQRGSLFRVPGKYPYEETVDFMVFETLEEDRRFGLMVTTGYKAGLTLVRLPAESNHGTCGLSKEWVIANWAKWIYPDCDVSQVAVFEGYEPGVIISAHGMAQDGLDSGLSNTYAARAEWNRLQRGTATRTYQLALNRPEPMPELTQSLQGVKAEIDSIIC